MRRTIAGLAAAALVTTLFAAPADARHRRWRHHHDVDAGDVIASAVVVGGIAALASAMSSGARRAKQDAAVDTCSREAESRLDGRVAHIATVTRRNGYYTVEGAVEGGAGFSCTIRNGSLYGFRSGDHDGA